MRKQYRVTLTQDERTTVQRLLAGGTAAARTLTRARILLKADEAPGGPGWSDRQIAVALDTSRPTVERVRKQFAQEGLELTVRRRRPRTPSAPKLDGRQEAHLVALTCSCVGWFAHPRCFLVLSSLYGEDAGCAVQEPHPAGYRHYAASR